MFYFVKFFKPVAGEDQIFLAGNRLYNGFLVPFWGTK